MKILYIGGTGEISYSCVQRDAQLGRDVTVYNRGRRGEPLPDGVKHITGELDDPAAYRALGETHWDVVCQFLAYDPEKVLRDIDVFGGRCGQYVFISSASVYQKPAQATVITEDTPAVNPYWGYSQAKIQMESDLLAAHDTGKINAVVVRPSHTFRRSFPGGIAGGDDWAWRILNEKPVIVQGDGTTLWTWTHSDDFAVPFCNLLGQDAAGGEVFHITRHREAYTWDAIYTEMGKALGVETQIVHVPTDALCRYNPEWAGPLLGDKSWCAVFDNRKVMSVAGEFSCEVDLSEGMRRLAEDFNTNRRESYQPDEQLHATLDAIIAAQNAVGPA